LRTLTINYFHGHITTGYRIFCGAGMGRVAHVAAAPVENDHTVFVSAGDLFGTRL